MTEHYRNPIAVIVGPIGNIQISIDSCPDIDLSCEDTFAPEGYDPCNQADHQLRIREYLYTGSDVSRR